MKKLILCILFVSILFAKDFVPAKHDKSWNYLFDSYSNKSINGAGIKNENIAIPMFTPTSEILDTFLYALAEGSKANIAHPEYFPSDEPEILISQTAEAFVTFYSEGAGYRNTLGFYTYEGDTNRTTPTSTAELKANGKIIFPNTSLVNSGGEMTYGLTVSLGTLSAGTKVIFFTVSNGWNGYGIRNSDWIFSTKSSLNLEYDSNSSKEVPDHKHVALLWNNVGEGDILLMGFEDILRTSNSCDHDFNDVLFSFSTSPMAALTTDNGTFATAPTQLDSDLDGVSDTFDEFDFDPQRAYTSVYPSENDNATLLFEDMWPKEGDYDMNDMSIEIKIKEIKNSANLVKEIQFTTKLKANGAAYKNGFAMQINTPIENIESSIFYVNGEQSYKNVLSQDSETTIVTFYTDAVKEFKRMEKYSTFSSTDHDMSLCNDPYNRFINVCLNRPSVNSPEITGTIILKNAVTLTSPPYNPFLIVNNGILAYNEVHLPNFLPTSLADISLFNTKHDVSDLSNNLTYKTSEDKPWALLIPRSFAYPVERANIGDVYIHYNDWVQSNGANYSDWYLHEKRDSQLNLYADPNRIYIPSND
jgi:LruC domain-containing protein